MNENNSLDHIRRRAARLEKMRKQKSYSPLQGFGAFGVIGWSVALPTVGGALLGMWLNKVAPQTFSWTITLILGGLVLGIIFSASWVAEQNQAALAYEEQDEQIGENEQANTNEEQA